MCCMASTQQISPILPSINIKCRAGGSLQSRFPGYSESNLNVKKSNSDRLNQLR
jgi:hypothetical protein